MLSSRPFFTGITTHKTNKEFLLNFKDQDPSLTTLIHSALVVMVMALDCIPIYKHADKNLANIHNLDLCLTNSLDTLYMFSI